ncbi:MAG TPA: ABC transporter permease [Bacteroidia bacterium]|jgi:ABC-type dipeptide/oligopeptide/nickel transport system permease subunit|nr:ABC transporter permease [Bacteroidia bacterium]HMU19907.1 ABC transporter permease [Bacteroidia bacterium]
MSRKVKVRFAKLWLLSVVLLAIFAPFIANEKPLSGNDTLTSNDNLPYEFGSNSNPQILHPIPYSPGQPKQNDLALLSPFQKNYYTNHNGQQIETPLRFHHWLGTDAIGADVAAGIVFGLRHSLLIAIFSMILSISISLIFGVYSGYFADSGIYLSRIKFISLILFLFLVWFYCFKSFTMEWHNLFQQFNVINLKDLLPCFIFFLVLTIALFSFWNSINKRSVTEIKQIHLNPDFWISLLTQVMVAVPQLIIIIALSSLFQPSGITLIFVFGLVLWVEPSRMIRTEVQRLRSESFVDAAIVTGLSFRQIVFRHLIPNLIPILKPVFLYGMAAVILSESGLSFIGLGVNPGTVTLGGLMAQAKENIDSWWLILFPGLCIFLTILSLTVLSEKTNS